jgi:MFS family permease
MLATYQQALRLFSREVRLFLVACALAGFTYFGIYALLLNLYLLRLGYDPALIGLVNGVGPLAMALGSLPAGALGQRWGSRGALLMGFSLLLIGFGLLPGVEFLPVDVRVGWLLATYMLAWLGGTFFVVITPPFLMGATSEQERHHAFAIQGAILPLAGFAGNLVGGLLPDAFAALLGVTLDHPSPYRYPLWIAAALLLFAVLAIWAMRPGSIAPPPALAATTDAAPYRLILMLALVFLLRIAGEWVMRIFFNVYLDAELHVSTVLIGALGAVGQLLGVAALSAPFVMARWGAVRTIG